MILNVNDSEGDINSMERSQRELNKPDLLVVPDKGNSNLNKDNNKKPNNRQNMHIS